MMLHLRQMISSPLGIFALLAAAAYLEVQGDACFQSGLYQASGASRFAWFSTGTIVFVCYSLFLNSARLDFGRFMGMYVVMFFVVAQIVSKLQFDQSPGKPVLAGGFFIVLGGLIMTCWKAV